MSVQDSYQKFIDQQEQKHLLRKLPTNKPFKIDFTHNDYLGLSQHPEIIAAAIQAMTQWGVGNKASRLVRQQQTLALDLEQQIALNKGAEKALVLCSGFQTNVSVLSALLNPRILGTQPLVFCDKLNHSSLHLGCQLAGIKQIRYRHLDTTHLAWLLNKYKTSRQPRFIITESVFGMDGDISDLESIVRLAKDHQAFLYVDEAHSTGLFGPKGYGHSSNFPSEIDMVMGTFSKALGCFGAYISCSQILHKYMLNQCQGLIYTTQLPPAQLASMQASWSLIPSLQPKVQKLLEQAQKVRKTLHHIGYDTGNSQTHIIPIRLSQPEQVINYQSMLADYEIGVAAIRPPSVPPLESRLRIALNVEHTHTEIEKLLNSLDAIQHKKV